MNKKIGSVNLDLSQYDSDMVYSDGVIEDKLLEIAKSYEEKQIEKELKTTDNWPFFYHFSKTRENILNWYPFEKDCKVLEIGAGCGAITGLLCKKCGEVVALDLSLRRSEINAYRHSDCDNLKIVVSELDEYIKTCNKQFDYIVMIGVLEYVGSYIKADDPYGHALNAVNSLLKKDGKLIIAIENRLGAKYFAGCPEDHLGTYFSSIEGYDNNKVRTFSLKEWKELLNKNSFFEYSVYYPYPDYKFPLKIYSDKKMPEKGELNRNYINLERERFILFNESRFYDSLSETDYFKDFSNSFLFVIDRK